VSLRSQFGSISEACPSQANQEALPEISVEKEGAAALGESCRRLKGKMGDVPRQKLTEVSGKRLNQKVEISRHCREFAQILRKLNCSLFETGRELGVLQLLPLCIGKYSRSSQKALVLSGLQREPRTDLNLS
jgi:hypothetical protein